MNVQQVIGNYCRVYGASEPEMDREAKRFFVTVSIGEAKVFPWRENSVLLGKIIGSEMKRGIVLLVEGSRVSPVTWEKWAEVWQRFFAPKRKDKNPSPNRERVPKAGIFQLMQQERQPRKPQKHGFERTHIANLSMNYL